MKRILLILALLLTVVSCSNPQVSNRRPTRPVVQDGKKAIPEFELTNVAGGSLKDTDLKGKVAVVDFWATWCPPCRASLPHTQKISKMNGKKITVLAISNEDSKTITDFMGDIYARFPKPKRRVVAYDDGDEPPGLDERGGQPCVLAFFVQHAIATRRQHLGHHQPNAVGADVDRRNAGAGGRAPGRLLNIIRHDNPVGC